MLTRYHDYECDSCGSPNDGDPISIIGTQRTYGVKDPNKIKMLSEFWLCPNCKTDYPLGAADFFTPEFFTEDELFCCVHCGNFIPEEVRDEYDDTEVCLTCSPPIDADW